MSGADIAWICVGSVLFVILVGCIAAVIIKKRCFRREMGYKGLAEVAAQEQSRIETDDTW